MASTYTPIATTTLGSAQSSVTFSSISNAYTDLVLIANTGFSSASNYAYLRFNSDSGSNYSTTILIGTGSSAYTSRTTNSTAAVIGGYYNYWPTTLTVMDICHIQNYSNTSTYKTMLSRDANGSGETGAYVSLWRNTSAINSVTLIGSSGSTFLSGSTFTLYGIKSA